MKTALWLLLVAIIVGITAVVIDRQPSPVPTGYDEAVTNNLIKVAHLMGMGEADAAKQTLESLAEIIASGIPSKGRFGIMPFSDDEMETIERRLIPHPEAFKVIKGYHAFLKDNFGKNFILLPCLDVMGSPTGRSSNWLPPQGDFEDVMLSVMGEFGLEIPTKSAASDGLESKSLSFLFDLKGALENTEKYYGSLLDDQMLKKTENAFAAYPEVFERVEEAHSFISPLKNKRLLILKQP